MEEREWCYSFILSRTPHETYITYVLKGVEEELLKNVRASPKLTLKILGIWRGLIPKPRLTVLK
jgi:hypothetical protein